MADEKRIAEYEYHSGSQSDYLKHFHLGYELIYIEEGEAEVKFGEKTVAAGAGSVIIIGSLDEHELKIRKKPYRRKILLFDRASADKYLQSPELLAVFKNHSKDFCHTAYAKDTGIPELFERIERVFRTDAELKNAQINCLIKELVISLYRLIKDELPGPGGNTFKIVSEIQRYLEENFSKELSLIDIADSYYVDRFYLSHIFKKYTGFSVKQYLLLNRLANAKKMLIDTRLQVKNIAAQCGFSDINNFIRFFKREFGTTPNAYRKQLINK